MPIVKRCCCCVTLRLGGITMGIMTLALSIFSIIPMVISFVNREFLAQVVTHLLKEMNNTESGMYIKLISIIIFILFKSYPPNH